MVVIKGLEKSSLIDYPGKISAVVFLAGCNFRCPFCHNRDLVLNPEGMESIPENEILDFLGERKKWLDGVVVTGGEPTIHKELPEFLKKLKGLGYPVKLDTNGSSPEMLKGLIEKDLVDYIAMDLKAPLEKYEKSSGVKVETENIRESIKLIIGSGIGHEFRSTVLPGLHTKEDVQEMARLVKGASKLYLQQFRPKNTLDPAFEGMKSFSEKEMLELRDRCREYVETEVRMA